MSTTAVLLIILLIVVAGLVTVMILQHRRSRKLRARFGPEYDRLTRNNSPKNAETILHQREKRYATFQLRTLSREQSDQFAVEWRTIQEHFVDDPRGAAASADGLIDRVLQARGYPVGNFDQQADDLSVEHARVVDRYRTADSIVSRDHDGASTEDLRVAMQHFRALFEELVDIPVVKF